MAYGIHVFRGTDWWNGTDNPITEEEMLKIEGVNPVDQFSANGQGGSMISINRKSMYSFNNINLLLHKGMLDISIRDDEAIYSIRQVANKLDAIIQGDEGEVY